MRKHWFAPVCIVLAGLLWGCIGLFVRPLNALGLASMDIVFLRVLVTSVVMAVVLLIYDRTLFKIKIKDIWCFLGTGIASIVFFNFCYFKAIEIESMAAAAVLLYTAPAIVMILSRFLFGEKFTTVKVLSLVLTFVGCVLVTGIAGQSEALSLAGLLAGLGAGFGYALYSIFGKFALKRNYSSMTITFYTFCFATVGSSFLADAKKIPAACGGDLKNYLLCAGFGIVCTVLPYLLYTAGLKHVENGKASIIASIEPVTAAVVGVAVYGETLPVDVVIGILLVIAGISVSALKNK